MEQIQLEIKQAPVYMLPQNEAREMYVRMALTQFRFLRTPNYNENMLLKRLAIDLKKMFTEAQALSEQFPNNYQLHRIRAFFDTHHKQLLEMTSEQ